MSVFAEHRLSRGIAFGFHHGGPVCVMLRGRLDGFLDFAEEMEASADNRGGLVVASSLQGGLGLCQLQPHNLGFVEMLVVAEGGLAHPFVVLLGRDGAVCEQGLELSLQLLALVVLFDPVPVVPGPTLFNFHFLRDFRTTPTEAAQHVLIVPERGVGWVLGVAVLRLGARGVPVLRASLAGTKADDFEMPDKLMTCQIETMKEATLRLANHGPSLQTRRTPRRFSAKGQ